MRGFEWPVVFTFYKEQHGFRVDKARIQPSAPYPKTTYFHKEDLIQLFWSIYVDYLRLPSLNMAQPEAWPKIAETVFQHRLIQFVSSNFAKARFRKSVPGPIFLFSEQSRAKQIALIAAQ